MSGARKPKPKFKVGQIACIKLNAIVKHLNCPNQPQHTELLAAVSEVEKAAEWARHHIEERGKQNDELRRSISAAQAAAYEQAARECEGIAQTNYTGGIDTADDYGRRCLEAAAKSIRSLGSRSALDVILAEARLKIIEEVQRVWGGTFDDEFDRWLGAQIEAARAGSAGKGEK